jgi:predicted phosphodiesterase
MKVAAIYDVHGNLPALEAVLDEIRQTNADDVVVGGDVLPGPMPRETLVCLRDFPSPVKFIQGNGEVAVLEQMAGRDPAGVPEPFRPVVRWTAQQLDSECARWLAARPKQLQLEVNGLGEILFCHATPRNENEIFTRRTSEERLLPVFAGVTVPVVVCGHTHMQFDRTVGRIRVLNAGSVGMPFGEPGADWLMLGPDIQFRHTRYDLTKAAERIRRTNYPQAHEFAARSIHQPPSGQEMLDLFSRAELG